MAAPPPSSMAFRLIVALAAFVIIVAGMKAAATLVVPILLAAFVIIITGPILYWLRMNGVPTWMALIALVLVLVFVSFSLVSIIGSSVTDFTAKLPTYAAALTDQRDRLIEWVDEHMIERFDDEPSDENDAATDADTDNATDESADPATNPTTTTTTTATNPPPDLVGPPAPATGDEPSEATESLRNVLSVDRATRLLTTLLGGLTSALSNVFLILLLVVFMLLETSTLPARLKLLPHFDEQMQARTGEILRRVRSYMTLKTGISLLTGLLVTVLLFILGVDYAVLWGILAFFLNYVPNIGSIIAAVPPVAVALVQSGVGSAALVAGGFVAINMVVGNVIEPRVLGKGLGMSTLVVVLSLVFWGWVLGPIGMLLSVPLTMVIQIVLEASPETRWLAVLMGSAADA